MTTSILNNDQSPEDLNEVYNTNYYEYLHSDTFHSVFLKPLGEEINRGKNCLDVACGEGWLADHVSVHYVGFDGSQVAIERARIRQPNRTFHVARLENPQIPEESFHTVVFANVFSVIIKEDKKLEVIEKYKERFGMSRFIVYDLQRLDTFDIKDNYSLTFEYNATAEVEDLQEVKKHRKIEVYSCC